MNNRKEYIDKLAAQLKTWDDDIQKLETKANTAAANLKSEIDNKISEMRVKKTHFENQLRELKNSSGDAWEEIKKGIQNSENNMKEAVNNAKEKFLA